jgi:hypothetical protein
VFGQIDPAHGGAHDAVAAEADLEALVRNDRTQPVTQKEIDAARAAIANGSAAVARDRKFPIFSMIASPFLVCDTEVLEPSSGSLATYD